MVGDELTRTLESAARYAVRKLCPDPLTKLGAWSNVVTVNTHTRRKDTMRKLAVTVIAGEVLYRNVVRAYVRRAIGWEGAHA